MQEEKLNLLYIAHERKLGGASLSLIALIKEIRKQGHNVVVIVPTSKCPVALKLKEMNIQTIAIFMPWWQMPSYWNKLTKICFRIFYDLEVFEVRYALFCLRNIRIDIVHSNSSVIDIGVRIANKRKCKHVWHIREFGNSDYQLEYLKGKDLTWSYINNHTDSIIFISQALMQYFEPIVDLQKSTVIYNGISKEYLLKKKYKEKEEVTFLISGNLNKNKQQLLVLQAANELLNRNINSFHILVAGSSTSMMESKQYEKELKTYVKRYLSNHVTMLGRIENMNEVRMRADVEIVASTREAFGRVTVEGMFAGMPVIVSDSGANTELVQDGVQGFVFHNGNHMDLADKMQRYIDDIRLIKTMGIHANKDARIRFMSDKNVSSILKLYYRILENSIE